MTDTLRRLVPANVPTAPGEHQRGSATAVEILIAFGAALAAGFALGFIPTKAETLLGWLIALLFLPVVIGITAGIARVGALAALLLTAASIGMFVLGCAAAGYDPGESDASEWIGWMMIAVFALSLAAFSMTAYAATRAIRAARALAP